MIETDKGNFKRAMNALMEIYYKPELSNSALYVWWDKLSKYDFSEVNHALDVYTNSESRTPPLPSDILRLLQHKVTIHSKLPSPLTKEANAQHAKEVVQFVNDNLGKRGDGKDWARKILASPKGRPDIAIRFAKEALNIN